MALNKFKDFLVRKTESGQAASLLKITAAIGWTLSALGQIGAILWNDKIPDKEKKFMIPQEALDAVINIGLFCFFTHGFEKLGKNLVKTGKIIPKAVFKDTNYTKVIKEVEKETNKKLKDVLSKKGSLQNPQNAESLETFSDALTTLFSIGGSILASNIITPVARNFAASKYQAYRMKKEVEIPETKPEIKIAAKQNPTKTNDTVKNYYKGKLNKPGTNFSSGMKV